MFNRFRPHDTGRSHRRQRLAVAVAALSLSGLLLVPAGEAAAKTKPHNGTTTSTTARHSDSARMKHVVKHRNPRNRQIKPYVHEHKQGTKPIPAPSSVPCKFLPPGKPWPSFVKSCY